MNTELKKKIEEADEQKMPEVIRINPAYTPSYHCGFEKGAEWGYKEAIEKAKAWLAVKGVFGGKTCGDLKQYITDFENALNKLWEG